MPEKRSKNRTSPLVRGARGDPELYGLPAREFLEAAEEVDHLMQIQVGNQVLLELIESLQESIDNYVDCCDLGFLPKKKLHDLAHSILKHRIVACAEKNWSRERFADEVVCALRPDVINLVGEVSGQKPEFDFDVDSWEQKLPTTDFKKQISSSVWNDGPLWHAIRRRTQSIHVLVESHMRLVQPYARKNMRQPHDFDDLMNEGARVLLRAAECFAMDFAPEDPGVRFSSYARTAISRELRWKHPDLKGCPRSTYEPVANVQRKKREMQEDQGEQQVTAPEVYQLLGLDEKTRTAIESARRLLVAKQFANDTLDSTLFDHDSADPYREFLDTEFQERLLLITGISRLTALERQVFIEHYFHNISFREMARRDKRSPKTLSNAFDSAREKLGRHIWPEEFENRKPSPK